MKLVCRILLWIGLVVLVLLGVAEGILWLAAPVPKLAGYTVQLDNEIPGLKREVSFGIDQRFLRTWDSDRQSGQTVHVVCLGGSATVAMLQNNPDAWWGQLGAMLQHEFPGARIKVSALAREAVGILYGAKWAQAALRDLDCDVLVSMYGFDDILLHPETYAYDPAKIDSIKLGGPQRGKLKRFLIDKSQICRRISNARTKRGLAENLGRLRERNYYAKALTKERAIYPQLPPKYELARPEGHDPAVEYVDGLKSLAATAKACNATFLAVGEPTVHKGLMGLPEEKLVHRWFIADPEAGNKGVFRIDSGRIEIELDRYFSAGDKACQALGVPFLNPQRKVPATAAVFVDDVLLSDQGAADVARFLLPSLKPLVEARLK